MSRSAPSGRLWVAIGLSPLLHIAGVAVVGSGIAGVPLAETPNSGDMPAPTAPTPPEAERQTIKLGIERSNAATITWIGFETPTPHSAMQADTEQPSLTRDAPSPPPQPAQVHAQGEQDTEQTDAKTAVEQAEAAPAAVAVEAEAAVEPVADPLALAELLRERAAPVVESLLQGLVAAPPEAAPDVAPEAAPETPAEEAAAPAAPPAVKEPAAETSPREADAFALEKPVVVRPGRPAAAEGLEIETRHLRLSLYNQVITPPGRTRVLATFNRQGRVTDVKFVKRTGITGVDETILNCVFSWRAKGRAIEALDPKDPEAGVVVPFEIVIR